MFPRRCPKTGNTSQARMSSASSREQLIDYIGVAAEGGAMELSAALLEYKNEHFPEYCSVKSLLL